MLTGTKYGSSHVPVKANIVQVYNSLKDPKEIK
jgi:hypothetical protein